MGLGCGVDALAKLTEGEVFAGYTIRRLLGVGGMGEVYLAEHPRLPRLDALKILALALTADEEFRARFSREADLAATLWHPHIVGVHDRGEYGGQLWISMEFVDGTDASHLLKERYPNGMPEEMAVGIVGPVADALDYAHEHKLLHRDVKPANILVANNDDDRRRVLLTDFGVARHQEDEHHITEANMAVGTVTYAAPELLTGKPLDARVDQYALAVTAFQLLTGEAPFVHENRAVVIGSHLNAPAPRLSEKRPDLAHLDAAFAKALAKNPADRFADCGSFARALTEPLPKSPARTQPLELAIISGTARGVTHPSGDGLAFFVEQFDTSGNAVAPVRVVVTGKRPAVADGDVVAVSGVWEQGVVSADTVTVLTRRTSRVPADPPTTVLPAVGRRKRRWGRTVGLLVAVLAVIAVAAVVIVGVVRGGFGSSATDSEGAVVKPVRATVYSPDGSPDNANLAERVIDGDPSTAWQTVEYRDAVPFPNFRSGMGLMLQLSEPTALGAVTVDLSSSGTVVEVRAADSATPAKLDDTTELAPPATLQPGSNRIAVENSTKTSYVLVWITTLGTTNGKSRTEIAEITLQAAG